MNATVLARRAFRIGLQTLFTAGGKWYVSIENRSYHSSVEIPQANVERWKRALEVRR